MKCVSGRVKDYLSNAAACIRITWIKKLRIVQLDNPDQPRQFDRPIPVF